MRFTILIPHYRTGPMTAYSVAKLLEHKGRHELDIVVIDNFYGDGSANYLWPFKNYIRYIAYPKDRLQSHGIAQNYALKNGYVESDYFICMESDSFPENDNWLNYYEGLVHEGYDAAGSLLKLSGGTYLHGCGGLFKKSVWQEAQVFCEQMPYTYFPNMGRKNGFDCHMMLHNSVADKVLESPDDWFELAKGYEGLSKTQMIEKAINYLPTVCALHNGMGGLQEDVSTYGFRNPEQDAPAISPSAKIISRIGYEPHQFFHYFMKFTEKKIFEIPTEIKWMPNREGQQQEYTLNEAGVRHLWGISSYVERGSDGVEDVFEAKRRLPQELYNSLPTHQKILNGN